jgi:hypothetical protein
VLLLNSNGTGFVFRKFFSFNEGAKNVEQVKLLASINMALIHNSSFDTYVA